jgi:hypothetical protein
MQNCFLVKKKQTKHERFGKIILITHYTYKYQINMSNHLQESFGFIYNMKWNLYNMPGKYIYTSSVSRTCLTWTQLNNLFAVEIKGK